MLQGAQLSVLLASRSIQSFRHGAANQFRVELHEREGDSETLHCSHETSHHYCVDEAALPGLQDGTWFNIHPSLLLSLDISHTHS